MKKASVRSTAVKKAKAAYKRVKKTSPPGAGGRFKAMTKIAKAGGAKNPKAVAAKIMWKKYGKKGGARLIKKGRAGR